MPENRALYEKLVAQYGEKRAEDVYWGMVGEGKGPFARGGKYRHEHEAWAERAGVTPVPSKKKPRTPAKRRPGAKRRR